MTKKTWFCLGMVLIGITAVADVADQSVDNGSQANVIEVPAYQQGLKGVTPEGGEAQKLEYEPVNDELPQLALRRESGRRL